MDLIPLLRTKLTVRRWEQGVVFSCDDQFEFWWNTEDRYAHVVPLQEDFSVEAVNRLLWRCEARYRLEKSADEEYAGNTLYTFAPLIPNTGAAMSGGTLWVLPAVGTGERNRAKVLPSSRRTDLLTLVASVPLYRWAKYPTSYSPSPSFVKSFWETVNDYLPGKSVLSRNVEAKVYKESTSLHCAWGIDITDLPIEESDMPRPSIIISGDRRADLLQRWVEDAAQRMAAQPIGDILLLREWIWNARLRAHTCELRIDIEDFVDVWISRFTTAELIGNILE